jgi:hypothetical protein
VGPLDGGLEGAFEPFHDLAPMAARVQLEAFVFETDLIARPPGVRATA